MNEQIAYLTLLFAKYYRIQKLYQKKMNLQRNVNQISQLEKVKLIIDSLLDQMINQLNVLIQYAVELNKYYKQEQTKHVYQYVQQLYHHYFNIIVTALQIIFLFILLHIEISKQLKDKKNKQFRDLQFSECKMIMYIFKRWKKNYIKITTILSSIQRGLQQDQEIQIQSYLNELTKTDLMKSRFYIKSKEIIFREYQFYLMPQ
ncbi:unnamed protein product [Paramecium sonneborni]|uniref:Transmembrane protein n=1 Tax=Paramecium sonneborni TaxID=65129 RepID=A0A8S1PTM9_9CILI|nr:unnamed protein product [Paramecium sonneborni]